MRGKMFNRFICASVAGLLLLTACGSDEPSDNSTVSDEPVESDQQPVSNNQQPVVSDQQEAVLTSALTANLAAELHEKYADEEPYEYTKPVEDIAQDDALTVSLGFDVADANYDEIFGVYIDRDLAVKANYEIEYDADGKQLLVSPKMTVRDPSVWIYEENAFYEHGEYGEWGYANQYYAVMYADAETGEKLERPLVTLFTVEAPLESPHLEFVKTENGNPRFRWSAVPGAVEYRVFLNDNSPDSDRGLHSEMIVTQDTEGTYESDSSFYSNPGLTYMNTFLHVDEDGDEFATDVSVYAVSADNKFSSASNSVPLDSIRKLLPYHQSGYVPVADTFDELGAYIPVTMTDDSEVMHPLTYDIESTEIVQLKDILDMNTYPDLDGEIKLLYILASIDGTTITAPFYVREYNEETLEEDLLAMAERIRLAKNQGGLTSEPTADFEGDRYGEIDSGGIETADGLPPIFASSALSEYLAVNMLSNASVIDLSDFPESFDDDTLTDAFYEAIYQNPLMLGISRYGWTSELMYIEYEQDEEELQRKQTEIIAEVTRVIGEIIEPGMTDIEKQLAINNYLVETAVYDTDALDAFMANDGVLPDNSYRDSFTPYGVLINKVGVCQSYATAFYLLAQGAGLESVVVTGFLNGNLPHAWNRVNIDGQWLTIDVTNNGNPGFYNIFFNLPDDAAAPVLVEDDEFVLDKRLDEFTATDGEKEYYRTQGMFFEKDEMAGELAERYAENGNVSLRTDYDLTEEELDEIMFEVVTELDAAGVTDWMESIYINQHGVIYLGDEEFLIEGN